MKVDIYLILYICYGTDGEIIFHICSLFSTLDENTLIKLDSYEGC